MAEHYLYSGSPDTLSGYVRYSDEALFRMWSNLGDAMREGTPRWKQTFGIDGAIFGGFYRSEEAMRNFLRGMHGFGMLTSPRVVAAFDLSRFRRWSIWAAEPAIWRSRRASGYPELRAVVFDLPRVTAVARENIARSGSQDRVTTEDGDFFAGELPEADLYAVGRILHDWDDEKAAILLRAIVDVCPRGAVLIAEKLLNEDGVGPLAANMQSLNMLVVTEGRERSSEPIRTIAARRGIRARRGSARAWRWTQFWR